MNSKFFTLVGEEAWDNRKELKMIGLKLDKREVKLLDSDETHKLKMVERPAYHKVCGG